MTTERFTFLVVDDERDLADLLANEIRERGHRAIGVWDLTTAKQVCEVNNVDAVLLDCFLKGYKPIDLENILLKESVFPRTYLMSGENPLPESVLKNNRDNTTVFYKPFDIAEAIELICKDLAEVKTAISEKN